MEWSSDGIIISSRRQGESSAIVEVFTPDHGRYFGLVRGGSGRRMRPLLQVGNHVFVVWKARLSEHLGTFIVELKMAYAAFVMDDALMLTILSTACSLIRCLPERHAHPRIYALIMMLLDKIEDYKICSILFIRYELALLEEMGYGLDLSCCVVNGSKHQLTHISPKSGRAVSAEVAEPYLDKLYPIPAFFIDSHASVTQNDIFHGFAVTGHFLKKWIYYPVNQSIPESRDRMLKMLLKESI